MKRTLILLAFLLLVPGVFAQTECSASGLTTYLRTQGSDSVIHQAICIDPVNAKVSLPWLGPITPTTFNSFSYANNFTGADDTAKTQACVNSLPNATHDGVCIVPSTMTPTMSQVTLGTNTLVISFSTAYGNIVPTYWSGYGTSEFQINGPAGFNTPYYVANNTGVRTQEKGTGIVFRNGGLSAGVFGLRNIWQLKSGNFGNNTAGVNADDLVLTAWQNGVYSTGTITSITNGSPTVTGSGTAWTTALVGGSILISGQVVTGGTPCVGCGTVLSVESATSLTLAENWNGTTAGPGVNYTITGGSPGTSRSRLTLGQNGVYLFNPNTGQSDPLIFGTNVATTGNRGYVLAAPDGNQTTTWVRINTFQAGGNTGLELRSSNSDAKRKFLALNDTANEFQIFAADGSTLLSKLNESGDLTITRRITGAQLMVVGTAPSCTFTSGGGTSPSCALETGSTNSAGHIQATTGTGAPGSTGSITLTFNPSSFGTNAPVCIVEASNGGAANWNARVNTIPAANTTTAGTFNWDNNAVALATSTRYDMSYICVAH